MQQVAALGEAMRQQQAVVQRLAAMATPASGSRSADVGMSAHVATDWISDHSSFSPPGAPGFHEVPHFPLGDPNEGL